jgi:HipA-like protein
MKALTRILRRLGDRVSNHPIGATGDGERVFELWYRDLMVGLLKEKDGNWLFSYSEDFKNQDQVKSLADFPKKSKAYRLHKLWPFFASRLPSLEQPRVQRQLQKENIRSQDTAELLRRYGRRSISNSFILKEG